MFKFFTKRWVSRKDYEEKEQELKSVKLAIEVPRAKTENEIQVIPSCIEELLGSNKRLREYTPSNPEIQELTIQRVVCNLAIEMQIQNNTLMTALRHLMEESKKPVNIENNA